jgi:hypothetical protein
MVPHFNAIWGVRKADEARRLSRPARAVLKVLRGEWEMATADLRAESGVKDRTTFTRAMDELQAAMIVIPEAAYYVPKFTYIWTLGISRFPDELRRRVSRDVALREIARCFLAGAGLTVPGELARVTGLSRPDAGLGNPRARERRLRRLALARPVSPGRGHGASEFFATEPRRARRVRPEEFATENGARGGSTGRRGAPIE